MKKSPLFAMALLVNLAFLGTAPERVYACSCAQNSSPQTALRQADAVFIGTAIAVSPYNEEAQNVPIEAMFTVTDAWKGIKTATVTVETGAHSGMCGFYFEVGKSYMVYADKNQDGTLETSLCSRTHELAVNDEDVAALGGKPIDDQVSAEQPTPSKKSTNIVLAVVSLLAIISIAISTRRK